jgi:hypothetical protein
MNGIYVIKENLPYGEDYLSYTVAKKAADCYRLFTGTDTNGNIDKLNKLLEERYGIVNSQTGLKPVYEIKNISARRWHCKQCGIDIVQNKTDLSRFCIITADGDMMGEVFRQDISGVVQTMDMLDNGSCPVCEHWSDGVGNTCSSVGWGSTEFFFRDCKLIIKKN